MTTTIPLRQRLSAHLYLRLLHLARWIDRRWGR